MHAQHVVVLVAVHKCRFEQYHKTYAEVSKRLLFGSFRPDSGPITIGQVSMIPGWCLSISDTDKFLKDLVKQKVLKRASKTECKKLGIIYGYNIIVK
jgi:hypothetical protein